MKGTPFVHGDFRGGLNTKAANYLVEDTQCRDCLNVQSTTTGAVIKRQGILSLADIGAATKTVQAIEATSSDHFLAMSDAKIFKVVGSVPTEVASGFSEGKWTVVEATADTTGPALTPVETSQGPVFLSNGSVSKAWDGTTLTNWTMDVDSTLDVPGSLVKPHKYSLVHESRVVTAGNLENKSTAYWSEVQIGIGTKPRTWMLENQQLFDPDDGDEITGLGRVGSNILVFKKHKVFVVYDINTGANRRLTSNIGCVSHRSIVETPNGTYFLADNGVYVTNGSDVQLVSDQITPTIIGLTQTSNATGMYFRNHYFLSSPTDGIILDYDLILKSWWKHGLGNSLVAQDFTNGFTASTEEPYCLTSSGLLGRMFSPGVYQDFDHSYGWSWAGPWLAPGQARTVYPAVRKRVKAIRVDGTGQATVRVDKDFFASGTPVTPQNANGTVLATLFPVTASTTFGDSSYFGDVNSSTSPATPTGPTTFSDTAGISQARIWGQGVARAWSLVFQNAAVDLTSPKAAIIQNYTIFTQERNV